MNSTDTDDPRRVFLFPCPRPCSPSFILPVRRWRSIFLFLYVLFRGSGELWSRQGESHTSAHSGLSGFLVPSLRSVKPFVCTITVGKGQQEQPASSFSLRAFCVFWRWRKSAPPCPKLSRRCRCSSIGGVLARRTAKVSKTPRRGGSQFPSFLLPSSWIRRTSLQQRRPLFTRCVFFCGGVGVFFFFCFSFFFLCRRRHPL